MFKILITKHNFCSLLDHMCRHWEIFYEEKTLNALLDFSNIISVFSHVHSISKECDFTVSQH